MSREHTLVFYDGHCGLCHRAVRFTLDRDPGGDLFRFAPLQGATFRQRVPAWVADSLTDSIVVQKSDGALLQQSDAILFLLSEMTAGWRALGRLGRWIPRPLRDLTYRGIARVRYRLFARPEELCPVVPAALRDRFLP